MDINDTSSGNVHTMDDPNGVKPIIISAVVVANVIFNSIVIAVISRYSQLREDRTTLFMFSLALSDLANGCVAMPISAALCSSAHSSERQENIILLKIQAVFSVWFTVTSMHNICWVTTCKMIALTNPFRYEQLLTRNRCYAIIVILWVIGALAGAVVAQTVSSWDESDSLNDLECSFFWSGKPEGERWEAGVGFAIKKDIVTKLTEMPRPVRDRIMTMRLPLSKDNFATIISVYAPTMTNPDENKEAFYNQLASLVQISYC
ncbi:hypothetical protein NP493_2001g00002 [Ridgeia piscesae]|uniref:G-protein coupled receptors family 1 profile domain-containing protein n=1 Tax=Ridgeia piscesae TaxID=27915 RepID=A0AAD9N483_RIDPI|nr:hypothetical protein NP493_2001g00002 [Ridgeia piscesae]